MTRPCRHSAPPRSRRRLLLRRLLLRRLLLRRLLLRRLLRRRLLLRRLLRRRLLRRRLLLRRLLRRRLLLRRLLRRRLLRRRLLRRRLLLRRLLLRRAASSSETFDGNTGLERFDYGIYHRDDFLVANTTWTGDHDLNCGSPDTQRTIHRDKPSESFYMCRDHLMTSIGDTSGYSTGWFTPKQTFTGATQVSWDVNVTDLGARQWWEVAIVPASFDSGVPSCPQCAAQDFVTPAAGLPGYPKGSVVVGKGAYGNDVNVSTNGVNRNVSQYVSVCSFDPEGCASKAIRRTFTITDNRNGTVTVNFGGFKT